MLGELDAGIARPCLGDFKVYSVTILDNYSRAVVASGLSCTQDPGTFLMILFLEPIELQDERDVMILGSGVASRWLAS